MKILPILYLGDIMKKKILLLAVIMLLLVGCGMANTPSSIVDDLFGKYQRMDADINSGIETVLNEQNLTSEHKARYRKLLEKQYKNLSYEIKNETIDGNNATVVIEIEVVDYKQAISDLTFDSTIYTKESFDEEKLNRLEGTNNKVTYTLDLSLTKNDDGKWRLNALTNEQIKKIQGMY